MPASVYSRTLLKAAEIAGGRPKLCRYLRVPAKDLDKWIAGEEVPPQSVFLQAVDLIVEDPPAGSEPGDPTGGLDAAPGTSARY
ncbi:MAG: hypothetical protein JO035_17035 [Betaproteobacteria bacterium]|nr:hypothetical protein [Betaproteobacteria bacterium]